MPRTVYLLVFNSPLFPAHWGLWIPSVEKPNIGKLLNATGDAATGFEIGFERNYDLGAITLRHQILQLAEVLDHHVVDVTGDGSPAKDQTAHDYLEQVALRVPAPARSLVPAASEVRDLSPCRCPY